ncbi:MAG: UrcA family protein [Alphaproteobacteria bacterium]|nr:UrcA family protein [Alphaproteobacteria bacterium]MBV9371691.1 UrcA family protein [Alphaproteobacteria bacterium]MBV9902467.1 UrcA family protein [Alphaproteobacteria bacterium]
MKTILAIAAAAAALGAAPALARDPAPAPASAVVRYADLDLGSPSGRRALDLRIGAAVRTVCGAASDADVHGKNLVLRCRRDTAQAVSSKRGALLASAPLGGRERLASGR